VPLDISSQELLRREHVAFVASLGPVRRVLHSVATLGMYFALFALCGMYVALRKSRMLDDTRKLAKLLLMVVLTVGLCRLAAPWRAEPIPLLLFAMTVVIAFSQELALLVCAAVALVAAIALGQGLPEVVVYVASMATVVLLLRRVRSRTKLIYVGLTAGAVTTLTTLGVGILWGQPVGFALATNALWYGFYATMSGLLMTSLLPFVERLFDVQTEISLLELGDVAHPLLQELVRRAPGTYNHSINVASIAEAAADAIGANGLLVRVGAYFHDIGKMLKPGYFVENQGDNSNRHEALMPAMSTLIIIAHVKDGADLARQHHLPQSMIDFILQHHGTTLVEFFYDRASQLSERDPDQGTVDEGSYRYPGPKPQTKEAAVLMVADAVESAARTLVDPTPSRIENLVRSIALKRLLDGQFDECCLTLQELRTVEASLVKSLAAVYHGRIKYPDRQRA
jgi:putative nucleotidyltransferase with HDIG domain